MISVSHKGDRFYQILEFGLKGEYHSEWFVSIIHKHPWDHLTAA